MAPPHPRDVDAYLAAAPAEARPHLRRLREIIRAGAPKAVEKISYGMPFYELNGRLIYFGGWKKHVALYAALPGNDLYARELKKYMAAKSTLQFPVDQPLPETLIKKLVKTRVKENEARARAASSKPKRTRSTD
jgi:uncharacterized protein YdhG (YjbR/CyaY superfamily)